MRRAGGEANLRLALRLPAAVVGYLAFYAAFPFVVVCWVFKAFGHPISITLLAVLAVTMAAAIALNYDVLSSKRAKAGMSVALYVGSAYIVLVAVLWIGFRHYWSWDITEDKRFTLSDKTRNWLAKLEERKLPLKIVSFLPYQLARRSPLPGDYKRQITDLLKLYERSPVITVTNTDPLGERAKTIAAAEGLGIKPEDIPNETVVLSYGEKRKYVGVRDLFDIPPPNPYGGPAGQAVFKGEDAVTSAIRDLLDQKARKVYFVTGHGERSSGYGPGDYGAVVGRLRGMNFVIEDLGLAEKGGVPEDADCVVIAGPTRPIPESETAAVESYLGSGGRLLVMLDHLDAKAGEKPSGLERILGQYGVGVRQDAMALGPESQILGERAIGQPGARHEMTLPLARRQALFHRACVLGTRPAEKEGYKADVVVEGTGGSWGERKLDKTPRYDKGDDVAGPTTLGIAIGPKSGMQAPDGPASIVVFADADFVSNQFMADATFRHASNPDLFLNAVNWMVGRTANIGIAPRERDRRTVVMTPSRRTKFVVGAVVLPALLMAALGICVWLIRSR
ncbi:MAG: GldG family protein [Planctomycetota bacterium]